MDKCTSEVGLAVILQGKLWVRPHFGAHAALRIRSMIIVSLRDQHVQVMDHRLQLVWTMHVSHEYAGPLGLSATHR